MNNLVPVHDVSVTHTEEPTGWHTRSDGHHILRQVLSTLALPLLKISSLRYNQYFTTFKKKNLFYSAVYIPKCILQHINKMDQISTSFGAVPFLYLSEIS